MTLLGSCPQRTLGYRISRPRRPAINSLVLAQAIDSGLRVRKSGWDRQRTVGLAFEESDRGAVQHDSDERSAGCLGLQPWLAQRAEVVPRRRGCRVDLLVDLLLCGTLRGGLGIRLMYTRTINGEERDMNYIVEVDSVPAYFGEAEAFSFAPSIV
jgi:hypothetical protein